MSMQACEICGDFYDTDKFPENVCNRCFDKTLKWHEDEKIIPTMDFIYERELWDALHDACNLAIIDGDEFAALWAVKSEGSKFLNEVPNEI